MILLFLHAQKEFVDKYKPPALLYNINIGSKKKIKIEIKAFLMFLTIRTNIHQYYFYVYGLLNRIPNKFYLQTRIIIIITITL